jgi:hypothetical protein
MCLEAAVPWARLFERNRSLARRNQFLVYETRFTLRRSQPETVGAAACRDGQQWSSIMSVIISLIYRAYCRARLAEIHKIGG